MGIMAGLFGGKMLHTYSSTGITRPTNSFRGIMQGIKLIHMCVIKKKGLQRCNTRNIITHTCNKTNTFTQRCNTGNVTNHACVIKAAYPLKGVI